MLHILWILLKFILIVLGIVLGLLLLAVLLLLFCPVRYRALAKKGETDFKKTEADASVSWLFHLLIVKFKLREGKIKVGLRVLGIPLDKFLNKKKAETEDEISGDEIPGDEIPGDETPGKVIPAEDGLQDSFSGEKDSSHGNTASGEEDIFQSNTASEEESASQEMSLFSRIWGKLKGILNIPVRMIRNLAAIPGRIIEKGKKTASTIRDFCAKIDKWKEFVNHPRTRAAIALVWKDAKGLIRHVLPTKVTGSLTIGSEDPALTGAALAVLGMSFPLHKNRIAVTPVFEGENVLEGQVALKGRIYGWVFVKTAIEIYFNKNVKYVIYRWKHKEE